MAKSKKKPASGPLPLAAHHTLTTIATAVCHTSGLTEPIALPANTRYVRFTLNDGTFFDVETILRDGVHGLAVRGSDSFGLILGVSNMLWLMPRASFTID